MTGSAVNAAGHSSCLLQGKISAHRLPTKTGGIPASLHVGRMPAVDSPLAKRAEEYQEALLLRQIKQA
jgi:hypothetical protein